MGAEFEVSLPVKGLGIGNRALVYNLKSGKESRAEESGLVGVEPPARARQLGQERGDAVVAVGQHRADKSVDAHLRCGDEVLGADGGEAVGRKHKVERGNCTAHCVGDDEPGGGYADRVAIRVAADCVVGRLGGESFLDPRLGEVEERCEFVKERRFAFDCD